MEIWDGHCHLSGYAGTPDERVGKLVALADRMGVDRLCIFMGANFHYDPTPEEMRAANDEVLDGLRNWHHHAFGFVYLNPNHLDASLAEFARCVEQGPMVAIKLWVAQHCDSPDVDAIVTRAAAAKAPIFQHTWQKITGNLPGESTAEELARLAARHPEATFICGHAGGDWENGIRAIRPHANVYADLGGGDPTAGFTEMAVRELGAERVIFGSDIPGRSYASQLAKVYGAQITEEAKRLIFSENLKRLLTPILKLKGVPVY
ncbi:MAG: amidohydrolase family protein [Candidatus Hydrogenedentes bacterium]|nr:amidohydrolase family protein [Candidatus Hydrogenedentota bacterium]